MTPQEKEAQLLAQLRRAEELRHEAHAALSDHLIATAKFKVGDHVRQAKSEYSRCKEGRVVNVTMKADYAGFNKPREYRAYGSCYPIKKDGTTAMKGEFGVTNDNVIVIEDDQTLVEALGSIG